MEHATTKRCRACDRDRPRADFYIDTAHRDGLSTYCRPCTADRRRDAEREQYRTRRAAGQCTACGEAPAATGKRACDRCCARRNTTVASRRAAFAAAGLCMQCGASRADAGRLCFGCWLRRVARDTLRDAARAELLRAIWDRQGGRCALTGAQLTPGEYGASLDHIQPVAKGGSHDPSNLRWVAFEVNRAKSDLTDAAFLAMCRAVVATADRAP